VLEVSSVVSILHAGCWQSAWRPGSLRAEKTLAAPLDLGASTAASFHSWNIRGGVRNACIFCCGGIIFFKVTNLQTKIMIGHAVV